MLVEKMINYLLLPIELIVAGAFFMNKLDKRKMYALRLLLIFLFTVLVSYLLVILKDFVMDFVDSGSFSMSFFWSTYFITVGYDIILFLLYVAMIANVYKTGAFNVIFVSCATLSVRNIANGLYYFFLGCCNIGAEDKVSSFENWWSVLVYLAIYAAVYVLSWLLIRTYNSGDERYLNRRILAVLILVAAASFIFSGVNIPQGNDQLVLLYLFVQIALVLLSIMGLLVEFYLLRMLKYRSVSMKQEQMLELQKEQFALAKESVDRANMNAHDLRNQLSVIMKAAGDSGKDALAGELGEMMDMVGNVDAIFDTGSVALDIVLTEKARACSSKGIRLSAIADGSVLAFMSELDIYSFFGNALDNATEAAEKTEADARAISLSVRRSRGAVLIHVENPCAEEPRFSKGIPLTTKEDRSEHGFGARSMAETARKYHGEIMFSCRDGTFCLDAIIPEREPSEKTI